MSFDPFQQPPSSGPGPNPYVAPQGYAGQTSASTYTFEDLKQIAQFQRWLIGVVGAQLMFFCGFPMLVGAIGTAIVPPGQPPPAWLSFIALAWYGVVFLIGIGTIVSLALVGNKIWGVAGAVLCGILGFVPCVSLITLLVVNGTATSILQRHGFTVGFLGCNDPRLK